MRARILLLAGTLAICDRASAQEDIGRSVLDKLDRMANGTEEAENAWPLYERVLKHFQHPPGGAHYSCTNVPGSPDWKHLAGWLDDNRDVLPILVAASHRDRYGMSYHIQKPIASVSLLHNRLFVNLLCAAAREAEAAGLIGEAIEYVHSAYRIGKQISDRPTLTDQAVGLALVGIASREARRLLVMRADALTTDQIAAVSTGPLLRFLPGSVEEVMRIERSIFPVHYRDEDTVRHSDLWLRRTQESISSQIDATKAVLEIIRYRHVNGHYPKSLDVFDSGVLSDADRFRYFPPKGTRGLVLYTVGEDGKDRLGALGLDELAAGKARGAPGSRVIIPVR